MYAAIAAPRLLPAADARPPGGARRRRPLTAADATRSDTPCRRMYAPVARLCAFRPAPTRLSPSLLPLSESDSECEHAAQKRREGG